MWIKALPLFTSCSEKTNTTTDLTDENIIDTTIVGAQGEYQFNVVERLDKHMRYVTETYQCGNKGVNL
jgi:hypothetical protein|tara:strand:+ start:2025 stop:2228 length:204 start_codon:yes stop_codon:yes gene_type:complete